jgi:RNA polymerase sigma-70 factor (ECF subfamily)
VVTSVLGLSFDATLQRARAGDETAFVLLFRDLQPSLLRYLQVMTLTGAEDLASDTWLEVVRSLGRFAGDERGFRAWVFTIARRRYIDGLRSMGRRAHEVSTEDTQLFEPVLADEVVLAAEEHSALERALKTIGRLPPAQAEVVMLRAVVGLTVAEVADVVGRRPGAVRILAHRGLRRLAEELSAQPGAVEV